jgi:hypothetical protein
MDVVELHDLTVAGDREFTGLEHRLLIMDFDN